MRGRIVGHFIGNRGLWLTGREREVIELISDGLSAKEIGLSLSIKPCTVERHVENVRLKAQARNRPHMVALVLFSGILNSADPLPAHA